MSPRFLQSSWVQGTGGAGSKEVVRCVSPTSSLVSILSSLNSSFLVLGLAVSKNDCKYLIRLFMGV